VKSSLLFMWMNHGPHADTDAGDAMPALTPYGA
jgi:hypothetical protein